MVVLLLPEALSLDIETDKLSYKIGETIRVSVSENAKVEYNGLVRHGKYVSFEADKLANKIIVNDEYEKLVHVSDGKTFDTCLNLGVFGLINLVIVKIMGKCIKIFI